MHSKERMKKSASRLFGHIYFHGGLRNNYSLNYREEFIHYREGRQCREEGRRILIVKLKAIITE